MQGSFVGINIYSLHRDETVWEDPFRFQPERFIDANGKLVNFEKTLAFGYGNEPHDFYNSVSVKQMNSRFGEIA